MASAQETTGRRGMVATAFSAATTAGWEMLRAGGNAVDAAVAAAWALSVCEPSASGLGGQTTLVLRRNGGQPVVIDGHSYAPAAVCPGQVSSTQQKWGYRACTIPSTPATLGFAQRRYGTLSLERVMEPAIRLAEDGYRITELQHRQTQWCLTALRASPAASRLFLRRGFPPLPGSLFRQKELAATLRRMARHGTEDFYLGALARLIAEDMNEHDGLLTEDDLAACRLPVERKAVAGLYRGFEVVSVPPHGGGLQLLLGLKVWERLRLDEPRADSATWYARLAEVIYLVFREREQWPVHPECPSPLLDERLLGETRAGELAEEVRRGLRKCAPRGNKEEPGETTHLCTADGRGNVVSLTQSIQSLFGAKVANARCGVLYNNSLTTCPRHPHPHQLQGGCTPRSNVAPTLVLKAGQRDQRAELFLALGAAGSRRITSALLQVISALLDGRLPLAQALGQPRVHATLCGTVWIERPAATDRVRERLDSAFPAVRLLPPHSFSMGAVQAIRFRSAGTLQGAADPRRDGTARGV
jgi:gamma-glutamyltranspeptidase/glutathione hydrolase